MIRKISNLEINNFHNFVNTAITSYKRLCANGEIENNQKQEDLIHKLSEFFKDNTEGFLRSI